jgi:hypothetical protein
VELWGHANIFKYLRNLDKLRVMNGGTCVKVYTVAVILRNCVIACYGGQSADYFNLTMPPDMLERYLRFPEEE